LMQGKSSVVSIKRGASSAVKDIRESIEFVESFEMLFFVLTMTKLGLNLLDRLQESSSQVKQR